MTTGAKYRKYRQSEANYVMESPVANQHCASCRWFDMHSEFDRCHLVESYPQPIAETGRSDFYAPYPEPEPEFTDLMQEFTDDLAEIVDTGTRETVVQKLVNRVKSLIVPEKSIEFNGAGFKSIGNRWFAMWTNNFEDDEGEIFPEAAIDAFIERVDSKEVGMPTLQYWHLGGDIGDADWIGRVDHIVLASGTYRQDGISQKFRKHFNGSKEVFKVSHGFMYPISAKQGNAYLYFDTFEISPLPAHAAANPFTGFGGNMLTKEKETALRGILGDKDAEAYIQQAAAASKEIEAQGRAYKDVTVIDKEARQGIDDVKSMLTELTDKLDKAMKKPDAKEEEEDDAAKKKAEAGQLKKELDGLATQVKGLTEKLNGFLDLTPRRATKDSATAIDAQSDLLKEAKESRDGDESVKVLNTLFGGMFGQGGG